ncbi:ribose-phosphate pyrophosphokinase [Leptolyngbya cf. ectocarpi LEGE 11479]|uniref:ribose-phosphate diphosphokinase n=1 Tax=Leptolyngbya cf. ectocarpi LEGE 11479 TaxID=1828722 RepID=A0A928X4R5_LEPEC|nr:ribose-phosphate pyrophosphokinase [Leptolyngbya ectocarpi]MBE9067233.1 ribose-phosphate pyrophosphokinase [Leptolyngbya cf. ectocarpi LEGE 11479]
MIDESIKLFSLNTSREFGKKVSERLGISLSHHEERDFEDGEHKVRSLINVRGQDVYVIQSLYGEPGASVNDKLCRLLFFVGALKDASAERVTAIVPYLCYARKDRKTKARDPVTTRYIGQLFEAMGCDRIVTLDVHNLAAFQNAFRCPTEHLEAKNTFVQHFATIIGDHQVVIVAPDFGGGKRAEAFRRALCQKIHQDIPMAFTEKYRSSGVVSGEMIVGEIQGRIAIIIDDLISSGTTLARTAKACRSRGATKVYAAVSHGVFAKESNHILSIPDLDKIIITNTVAPFRITASDVKLKLTVLDTTPLFAETIRRLHDGGSLVELLDSP